MRLREIDFLRGLAVILVLFRHYPFAEVLTDIGWIGVDLFFVLSGYLVSNLLFQEYAKHGSIGPGLFLVRRGFKIYPLFYLIIAATVVLEQVLDDGVLPATLGAELFFVQNYFPHLWAHTWSLAAEEHFYLVLTFGFFILARKKLLDNGPLLTGLCLLLCGTCLVLRVWTNLQLPYAHETHLFPTHLRLDSLLSGVLIAAHYNFNRARFVAVFTRYRPALGVGALGLILLPFFFKVESFFMNTFGLTGLYVGFGTVLCLFLADVRINNRLNAILSKPGVNLVSFIGYYSYAIYLCHVPVIKYGLQLLSFAHVQLPVKVIFVLYFVVSVAVGYLLSVTVEQRFLAVREKFFPKRGSKQPQPALV